MFKRQTTGSVVCASCGSLVGVNDERCYTCGRRNPGLWGFGPMLRPFGNDLGFVALVVYGCSALYIVDLLITVASAATSWSAACFSMLGPGTADVLVSRRSGAEPVFVLRALVDGPQRRLAARRPRCTSCST